jgi:DNA-binding NarL/FixJ family response regulator
MSSSIRVLIVDDHPVFALALGHLLASDRRVEVVGTATSGREAIELAQYTGAQVVLMDMNMPDIGGIEATRALLTEQPDLQVILVTGHSRADAGDAATASGAAGFLLKGGLGDEVVDEICRVTAAAHTASEDARPV